MARRNGCGEPGCSLSVDREISIDAPVYLMGTAMTSAPTHCPGLFVRSKNSLVKFALAENARGVERVAEWDPPPVLPDVVDPLHVGPGLSGERGAERGGLEAVRRDPEG